ncbi:ABC transporter substrate-binding protein [Alicyclobacillus vulcanalis]|uniref:Iron complex transport system substrate-binding protein n=1 Tax=Alicyclobacillus vulcanalis TaxID=252246 RepID=A0A1N7KWY5_9BACL|nr:ABC transporter substrate-binding protein [Alicyclobacillus vulcanalis]SIS65996.1 iron complex transport system substrate-binding protein [Alicyclobacillus vulcanalis]
MLKDLWLKGSAVTAALVLATAATGCGSESPAHNNSLTSPQSAASTVSYPMTVKDDMGDTVTLKHQPMHIVSGSEGTDEILVSLVPKSRIALVTTLASNPEYSNVVSQVKGIPAWSGDDPEQALAVHPDLVLEAGYVNQKVLDQLHQAGVPLYSFSLNDFDSIFDIERNILTVGRLVGEPAKANAVVSNMKQQLAQIERAVQGQPRPTVLDYGSYGYAAGRDTTVDDIIRDAGGVNVAHSLSGWQKITDEQIVKWNPSVIIDSSDDAAFLKKLASDPALQSVAAVREHHLYAINSADLSSVSQYVVRAVYDVAKVLHPSAHLQAPKVVS